MYYAESLVAMHMREALYDFHLPDASCQPILYQSGTSSGAETQEVPVHVAYLL